MENLKNVLSILVTAIALASSTGIILGGFSVHSYLNLIGHTTFFTSIYQQSSLFLLPSFICLLFFLVIFICFSCPAWLIITIREKNLYFRINRTTKNKKYWKILLFIILFSPIIYFSLLFLFPSYNKKANTKILTIITIILIITPYIMFIFSSIKIIKKNNNKNWKSPFNWDNFLEITPIILVNLLTGIISFAISFLISIFYPLNNIKFQTLAILFSIAVVLLNNFSCYLFLFKENSKKDKNPKILFLLPLITTFLYCIITAISTSFFIKFPLETIGAIDLKPRWYIIESNPQINFENKDIIRKYDIEKLKQFFKCDSEKCSTTQNSNKYALYGYMAWNAGDTKIFCPPTAQFGLDKKKNLESAEMCLFIESKFIKPLREMYSGFDDAPHSGSNTSWL